MTICSEPASNATVQAQPCDHAGKGDAPRAPALMKDCAGVDLQLAQDPLPPIDPAPALVDAAPLVVVSLYGLLAEAKIIPLPQGPPDERLARLNSRHLATQRLLI